MRFLGHDGDDLHFVSHAAFVSANLGEQPVIKPFPPTEPRARERERYARHEHQVQLV